MGVFKGWGNFSPDNDLMKALKLVKKEILIALGAVVVASVCFAQALPKLTTGMPAQANVPLSWFVGASLVYGFAGYVIHKKLSGRSPKDGPT